MSTSIGQPNPATSWKQEVSQRIAAHQSRRGPSAGKPAAPVHIRQGSGGRAGQAAARVAARYAQAPSYSQMLEVEADPAPRAGDLAPQAALTAQAASQSAVAGPQAVPAGPRLWQPEVSQPGAPLRSATPERELSAMPFLTGEPHSLPASLEAWENEYAHARWEPDLRLLPLVPASEAAERLRDSSETDGKRPSAAKADVDSIDLARGLKPPSPSELSLSADCSAPVQAPAAPQTPRRTIGGASSAEESCERPAPAPELVEELWDGADVEPEEPAVSAHANLIEFPRELVAARRMRPRRAEGPFAVEELGKQLKIFEVDPATLSTGADTTGILPGSAWPEADWSGIELEAQSREEPDFEETPAPEVAPELAPMSRRLLAAMVDGALMAGVGLGSAFAAAAGIGHPLAPRIVALGAVSALLLAGMIYETLFLTLAGTTPGMWCARISLCTFDDQIPTGGQIRSRLGALLLSVVPMGLGIAWALFDDEHLCWHDRLSQTYLRKC